MSHLISSHANKKLPENPRQLLRRASTYVCASPKRCAQLAEFQDLYAAEHAKLLQLSFTRWLVLHPCIVRFLELYDCLKDFFQLAAFEDARDTEAKWLVQEMKNPFTKAYLLFLKYVLDIFNKFNAVFQTKDVIIHKLARNSERILIQVCQNFVKPEHLQAVGKVTTVAQADTLVSCHRVIFFSV